MIWDIWLINSTKELLAEHPASAQCYIQQQSEWESDGSHPCSGIAYSVLGEGDEFKPNGNNQTIKIGSEEEWMHVPGMLRKEPVCNSHHGDGSFSSYSFFLGTHLFSSSSCKLNLAN